MRDIKFRAWVKEVYENGEFQYGGYMIDNIHSLNFSKVTNLMLGVTPVGISYYQPMMYFGSIENLKQEEIELMQYTGLKDKNGKEIYEGDIVGFKGIRAKIIYGFCGFEFEWIDGNTDKIRQRKTEEMFENTSIIFEVIGNIYEVK